MFAFLLPLASKIISDAVAKIPENEESIPNTPKGWLGALRLSLPIPHSTRGRAEKISAQKST